MESSIKYDLVTSYSILLPGVVVVMGATQRWRGPSAFVFFDVWLHCVPLCAEHDCDAISPVDAGVGSEKGTVSVPPPLRRRAVLS